MLKVLFPVEASNKAMKEGALEKTIGKMLEQLKADVDPRSSYSI